MNLVLREGDKRIDLKMDKCLSYELNHEVLLFYTTEPSPTSGPTDLTMSLKSWCEDTGRKVRWVENNGSHHAP